MRPLLLDLFCGAGGAAMGYHQAGFDVVGVDIKPQPHYPFEFWQTDALAVLETGGVAGRSLASFDAIHASPPCQRYSKSVSKENRGKHPDLIAETRGMLRATGLPYVIENVPRAPLLSQSSFDVPETSGIRLCGSSFGLPIQRHRLFESNIPLVGKPCNHDINEAKYPPAWNRKNPLRVLSISGGYQKRQLGEDFMDLHKAAMGIDWDISYNELSEAIPPAYTKFIGEQLIRVLEGVA